MIDLQIHRFERIVLLFGCIIILSAWTVIFLSDINHPPGVRWARLAGLAIAIALGSLETVKPWAGFYAFLLLWPQLWILRDVLQHHVSGIFSELPMVTSGPVAAALGIGVYLRTRGQPVNDDQVTSVRSIAFVRGALWCLAAIWALSAAVSTLWLLKSPHKGWHTDPPDWRHLTEIHPFSALAPASSALRFIPEFLLGLLLLNQLATNKRAAIPWSTLLRICGVSALLVGIEFAIQVLPTTSIASVSQIVQKLPGRTWPFDENPPSGPFKNRNTTGPVLIMLSLLVFAAGRRDPSRPRKWRLLAFALLVLSYFCNSRNTLFMLAALAAVVLFSWARTARKLWVVATVLALFVAALFWAPLPPTSDEPKTLDRAVQTIQKIRQGDWAAITGYRNELYSVALKIFAQNPVLGAGPKTFPMLAGPGGKYFLNRGEGYHAAHSMPLNLLAETGIIGAASWLTLWLIIPAVMFFRSNSKSLLWLAALIIGIGNLLDTVWLTPGVTTLSVLIICWACWETSDSTIGTPASST